jgi:hypothetical protein
VNEKLARIRTRTVIAVTILAGLVASADQERHNDVAISLAPIQQEGLETFFSACFPGRKVSVTRVTIGTRSFSTPPAVMDVRVELEGKRASLSIGRQDGKVYRFSTNWHASSMGPELISESQAWETCKPFLAYLGIEQERATYDLKLLRDDSGRDFWFLSRDFVYEEIPCRGSRLRMQIAASRGVIENFYYAPPFPPPNKPLRKLSKESAIETATKWLAKSMYFGEKSAKVTEDLAQVVEVIAPPNDLVPDLAPLGNEDSSKMRYCWEVPFDFEEGGHPLSDWLWVDVETGRVIGIRGKQ